MDRRLVFLILAGFCFALSSSSQTKYFTITSVIQNHFAETTMESQILNDQNTTAAIKFQIMLPQEAYITHFEMEIDGKTYSGVIEEKQKAKKKFTEARRRGHTAGLVESREKADKIFATDVNIGANTVVTFKLVYQQLLKSLSGKYTDKIILFGDSLSEYLSIDIYICEPRAIVNLEVPPILLNKNQGTVEAESTIQINNNTAHVSFVGNNQVLNRAIASGGGAFSVVYELEKTQEAAEVVVDDGYFIYFGPDIPTHPSRIIFCLDDSGSMSGLKSRQVKQAMHNILDKLTPEDRLGIIKFSSSTRSWKPELVDATRENIRLAQTYVAGSDESGGTRIWKALNRALRMMGEDTSRIQESDPRANIIILLSDGHGDLSGNILRNNVNEMNNKRFTIHTISFGDGADDGLLQTVANENHGRWKKILSDLDSALQIENYVGELKSSFTGASAEVIRYPNVVAETFDIPNYGGELMSVGRFHEDISLYTKGPHSIRFNAEIKEEPTLITTNFYLDRKDARCNGLGGKQIQRFAAKAFSMTKVEKVLKEYQEASDPIQKDLLKQRAINMSLEYQLVTPVTSLLVIKPEVDREIEESLAADTTTTTTTTSAPLTTTTPSAGHNPQYRILGGSGRSGGLSIASISATSRSSRPPQWSFHSDPHFVARLSDDVVVCFNWIGRNNEAVNLLNDYEKSIVINGLITGEKTKSLTSRLFVTKMVFLLEAEDVRLEVDKKGFIISNMNSEEPDSYRLEISLRDIDRRTFEFGILRLHIVQMKRRCIIVNVRIGKALFVVEIHYRNESNPNSRDHLDLIVPDYNSTHVGGIFGHLQVGTYFEDRGADIVIDKAKNKAFLLYNNDKIEVRRSRMKIPYMRQMVDCWLAKGHLQHLFGAKLRAFKLSSLSEIPAAA